MNSTANLASQILIAPFQVDIDRPPILFDVPINPGLSKCLPVIISCSIMTLQERINNNRLRLYLYNILSTNGYNNEEFFKFVKRSATYLEYKIVTNQIVFNDQSWKNEIKNVTNTISDLMCIEQAVNNNELNMYIEQDVLNNARQSFPILQTHISNIARYEDSLLAKQSAAPMYSTGAQNQYSRGIPQQTHVPSQRNNVTIDVQKSVVKEKILDVKDSIIYAYENKDRFSPSNKYHHDYLINLADRENTVVYEFDVSGNIIPVIRKIMDQSKHFITSSITPKSNIDVNSQPFIDRSIKVREQLSKKIKLRVADQETIERAINMKYASNIDSTDDTRYSVYPALSDAEVWQLNDLKLSLLNLNSDRLLTYGMPACFLDIFISTEDPKPLIDKIIYGKDFHTATNFLKNYRASIEKTHTSVEAQIIINRINQRLTNEVNYFINNQLSLKVKIDSFYTDANDILNYIDKQYETLGTIFRAAQPYILNRALRYSQGCLYEKILNQFVSRDYLEAEHRPVLTFFEREIFYVSINATCAQLEIDTPSTTTSVVVDEKYCKEIHELALSMFEQDNFYEIKFVNYYLKTNDNVVFEFIKGQFDDSVVLIRLKT